MIALFAINNALQLIPARNDIRERVRLAQSQDANYLGYGVQRWASQIYQSLTVVRNIQSVQSLLPRETQAYFDILQRAFPAREFALFNRQGHLIAATNPHPKQSEANRQELLSRTDFQRALEGEFIYEVGKSVLTGKTCLLMRAPVYPPGMESPEGFPSLVHGQHPGPPLTSRPDGLRIPHPIRSDQPATPIRQKPLPIGVLTFCLPLDQLDQDSGLIELYNDVITSIGSRQDFNNKPLSLNALPKRGSVFLLLTNDGHILFPDLANKSSWLMTPQQVQSSPWGPLVSRALQSENHASFKDIWLSNRRYLLTTLRIDPVWSIALIVDRESAFRRPDRLLWTMIGNELLALFIAAIVINVTCSQAAKPVQQAGSAIRRLASGEFDVQLPLDRRDEIGHLYRDIHETGKQLQNFLNQEASYLVTRKQIETGRSIQKSFLVDALPESSYASLAASFNPAQEVAGDWYDAIEVQGITYVVIADVCDKGVGAALFMSVFRTLVRYEILRTATEDQSTEDCLASVACLVNNYMASTHRDLVMFATLFVASIDPASSRLSYICAGHEMPFILRSQSGSPLERLEVNGPAVGVFPNATYAVNHISLRPGDLLFAYTDGLTDARSPDGTAWGLVNLESELAMLQSQQASAQDVISQILSAVNAHMGGAEPFDDLTMLALKFA
jgi:serine phosphatase RsbU (regulator of sigma subunit)